MYICPQCGDTKEELERVVEERIDGYPRYGVNDECDCCNGCYDEAYKCGKCGEYYSKEALYGQPDGAPWGGLCAKCQREVKAKADRMFKVLWNGLDEDERKCLDEMIESAVVFDTANIKEAV